MALSKTQVSQLYVSIFGRASDGGGNIYWQSDQPDRVTTADVMLDTGAARDHFGITLYDNRDFIETIYKNSLGKTIADDPGGIAYWVAQLDGGKPKGQVVVEMIDASMDPVNAGAAQDRLNNKVAVSDYTADSIAEFTNVSTFTGFISEVDDRYESVLAARSSVAGFIDTRVPAPAQGGGKYAAAPSTLYDSILLRDYLPLGIGEKMSGSVGNDDFDWHYGNNIFTGNGGSDVYSFGSITGHDIISDFNPLNDFIDIGGWTSIGMGSWGTTIGDMFAYLDTRGDTVLSLFDGASTMTLFGVGRDQWDDIREVTHGTFLENDQLPHPGVSIPSYLDLDWVDTEEIAQFPNQAIGRISVENSSGFFTGTGFMISPEHVLTNAHVLLDEEGEFSSFDEISFYPGQNGTTAGVTGYGWSNAWWQTGVEEELYEWPDDDLAIIRLDEAAGETLGYFGWHWSDEDALNGLDVMSAGYADADIIQDDPSTRGYEYYQWEVSGTIEDYHYYGGAIELSDPMRQSGGASGSPIFHKSDGTYNYVGVYAGTIDGEPVAAALDRDSFNWILGILQGDGYYLDYDFV